MSNTFHAFDFLAAKSTEVPPIVVVFGNESFLKRLVIRSLRRALVSDEDSPFTSLEGANAEWRDVVDELSTMSLFGGERRLVIVESADPFVSKERIRLETYVEKPRSTGVLILEVDSWASNTRLYKAVDKIGLQVNCRAPEKLVGKRKVLDEATLCKWLVTWTKQQHDAKLESTAAEQLLEIIGAEFGLLDQELSKLALFAGEGGKIDVQMVRDVVGGWRTQTIWELIDAAADGDAGEALKQLDRLLQAGEHPVALFGQISWSLRRFAAATRIYQDAEREKRRILLRDALIQAGIPHWNRKGLERAESQLKQLGRRRAGHVYRWLLETDLALKGTHSNPHRARFALEQLFLRMAKGLGNASIR
ncbi:MAG: DNA polymerase III subunit delta [Planctomycetaceae bacterium]|nr:DNA polymerase III subunit delta [Planctomycetales bacterium]MCB9924718.1 DNA polymerase III subunit delta [Planctomycetaceae bacterium]